jgi:hypothetical protein
LIPNAVHILDCAALLRRLLGAIEEAMVSCKL